MEPPALSPLATGICGLLILLIPFAYAGLAMMNSGLGRSRGAVHSLMSSLTVIGAATLVFVICGSAFEGYPGRAAYAPDGGWKRLELDRLRTALFRGSGFRFRNQSWRHGRGPGRVLRNVRGGAGCRNPAGSRTRTLAIDFRRRFRSRFRRLDLPRCSRIGCGAGAGWRSWELSSRPARGLSTRAEPEPSKWSADCRRSRSPGFWVRGAENSRTRGCSTALPGHNAVFVTFGAFLLALIGWFGLNSSAAILFYGAAPTRIGIIAVNTVLSAASALLAAALVTRTRFGKPDALRQSANGWTAGLAASERRRGIFRCPRRRSWWVWWQARW